MLVLAPVLAADDLVVKSLVRSEPWNYHERSHWWAALSIFLIPCVLGLAALPSRGIALSAGALAGGGLGNLISALGNGMWVPNPFVLGAIAFNLADVFVLVGALGLMGSVGVFAIRHREHLLPPRRWEQAVARRAQPMMRSWSTTPRPRWYTTTSGSTPRPRPAMRSTSTTKSPTSVRDTTSSESC